MQIKSIIDKIKTEVLVLVCQLSNKAIDNNLIELWIMALSDLSNDELDNGLQRTAREYKGTFLMAPAQFREYCLTNTGESVEDEASKAWEEMIKRYTCTRSAYFKNPITAEVLREMGKQMFYDDPNNLKFWKKDFIKSYKVHKTRDQQYDPFILKEGDTGYRLIGEFTPDEKDNVKLEYSRNKAKLITGKVMETLGVKEQTELNKSKIGSIMETLK